MENVELLLNHPKIDIHLADAQGRCALHMAVWGEFGGRNHRKSSSCPTDTPECTILLLKAGANPNQKDRDGISPLGIACGTGGNRCIDLLMQYNADINHLDNMNATPLHQCMFRGNIDCFKKLI